SGALTKQGSGTLTLSGDNSYSGGTRIRVGTIRAAADDAVQGDYIIEDDGVLDVDEQSVTLTSLAGEGAVRFGDWSQPTLTIDQAGDTEFSGSFEADYLSGG